MPMFAGKRDQTNCVVFARLFVRASPPLGDCFIMNAEHETHSRPRSTMSLPLTATSYPLRYSEIGLNLADLGHRLPGFCISPDLIAPDGGADI
jgi:hypothetical protein